MAKSDNTHLTCSPEETAQLAENLMKKLKKGSVLCLYGDLGSGKTTFIQGLGKGLGIRKREIKSPTYVYMHTHEGRSAKLYHFDLYRSAEDEMLQHQIGELFDKQDGIIAIEWADRMKDTLPKNRIDIHFEHHSPKERKIQIIPR